MKKATADDCNGYVVLFKRYKSSDVFSSWKIWLNFFSSVFYLLFLTSTAFWY